MSIKEEDDPVQNIEQEQIEEAMEHIHIEFNNDI